MIQPCPPLAWTLGRIPRDPLFLGAARTLGPAWLSFPKAAFQEN